MAEVVISLTGIRSSNQIRLVSGRSGVSQSIMATGKAVTRGVHGEAGKIKIGEVTTLPPEEDATVDNVGSEENAILDFGIPKGDRGADGTTIPIPTSSVPYRSAAGTGEPNTHATVATNPNGGTLALRDVGGRLKGNAPVSDNDLTNKKYTDDALNLKVDKVTGKGLSTEDYTTTEKNKLAGIADNATANDADANLKNRANHTGEQAISTVTGLQTALDGKEGTITKGNLVAGANVTLSGTLTNRLVGEGDVTISSSGGGGGGSSAWGDITGTLTNQTDLKNALDAKADANTLASVATSGSYNDLSSQPTIPTNNNQLTNGAGYITSSSLPDVSSFITASSADTLTNKSGNISQWTNDSGYLTTHQDISGKEDSSNKVTSFSTPTDVQYPSAKLVKDQLDGKQASLGFTAENSGNKDDTTTLGTSTTKYPTQNAVKTYVDNNKGLPYSGTSKITVGTTAPSSPTAGDLWVDTNG